MLLMEPCSWKYSVRVLSSASKEMLPTKRVWAGGFLTSPNLAARSFCFCWGVWALLSRGAEKSTRRPRPSSS